ncbi:hypothetical protein UFOVP257_2 [uncultured Caudovirales phage]|uniref:Uncharacterized protein n=1 Tax=uncultured Caudovirales phage TaxID=2100421 RepID=A0A6J5LHQ5_9CAUD|nr:hypothetical protein UFOVP257_2 [uncultured Caudovirales phage]
MSNKLKISKTPVGNTGTGTTRTDRQTSPTQITSGSVTGYPGSVGGVYTQAGAQIHAQVDIGNGATDGSLLTQKGAHKFLCTDGTTTVTAGLSRDAKGRNVRICKLVPSMVPDGGVVNGVGQVSVPVYTAVISGNIADTAGAATSSYLRYDVASLQGNGIKIGANVMGATQQSISGNVTITAVNATVGGRGNVTVAFSSQDGDAPTGDVTFQVGFFASRVSNRWVWDFAGNKYRYWSQLPTTGATYNTDKSNGVTGFVQIPDAS